MDYQIAKEVEAMQAQFDSVPSTSIDVPIGFTPLPHLTELSKKSFWHTNASKDFSLTSQDTICIRFVYPFSKPIYIEFINSHKNRGFSRNRVVKLIVLAYQRFYAEEERTSTMLLVPHTLNRGQSNGKYGIWGHFFSHLVLEKLYFDAATNTVAMFIGS